MVEAEPLRGLQRMVARAIGEDELAAGQRRDGRRQRSDWAASDERSMSCTKARNSCGIDAMFAHQAAQRRAVALIIIFLQRARRQAVEAEECAS